LANGAEDNAGVRKRRSVRGDVERRGGHSSSLQPSNPGPLRRRHGPENTTGPTHPVVSDAGPVRSDASATSYTVARLRATSLSEDGQACQALAEIGRLPASRET